MNASIQDDRTLYTRATALIEAGDTDAATSILLSLAEHNTPMWEPYNDLGVLAQINGDLKTAQSLLRLAVDRDNPPGVATSNLSDALLLDGEYDEAATLWGTVLSQHDIAQVTPLMSGFVARATQDPMLLTRFFTLLRERWFDAQSAATYQTSATASAPGQPATPHHTGGVLQALIRQSALPGAQRVFDPEPVPSSPAIFHYKVEAQAPTPPFPAIVRYEVERAFVMPFSDTMDYNGQTVVPDFIDLQEHLLYDTRVGRCTPLPVMDICAVRKDRVRGHINRGVVLTSYAAVNWSHFLTEVLPVAALVEECGIPEDVPLVVSSGMHQNMFDILDMVKAPGRRVIPIAGNTCISHATIFSPVATVPYDYARWLSNHKIAIADSDCLFSRAAFNILRMRFARHTAQLSNTPATASRKLYIRRNSEVRRITNGDEVARFFAAKGFDIVEPEKLGARQQQALFASARIIAGQSGAGLANMLFAPPGTRILVLTLDSPNTVYNYFTNMAGSLGHELHYFGFAPVSGSSQHAGHPDMHIKLETLAEYPDLFA